MSSGGPPREPDEEDAVAPRMAVGDDGREVRGAGDAGGPGRRPGRPALVATLAVVLVVAAAGVVALALSQGDPALVAPDVAAPLPGVPEGAVVERWTRPVARPVTDLVVVGDTVVLVELAPLQEGLAAGVLLTAFDGADGRPRWQRRVPGRSLVVVFDGRGGRGVVDVASAFDTPSTVRGLALDDGREVWARPADGARRIGWDPAGAVVLSGDSAGSCATLDEDGPDVRSEPIDPEACEASGRPLLDVVVARADDSWRVDADPDGRSTEQRSVRVVVQAPDGRTTGSLPGSDRLVFDAFDDRPLGGQLTTRGVLVAGTVDALGGDVDSLGGDGGVHALGLLAVPDLRPRWVAQLAAPAERVASSTSLVAVLTRADDDRARLAVLR